MYPLNLNRIILLLLLLIDRTKKKDRGLFEGLLHNTNQMCDNLSFVQPTDLLLEVEVVQIAGFSVSYFFILLKKGQRSYFLSCLTLITRALAAKLELLNIFKLIDSRFPFNILGQIQVGTPFWLSQVEEMWDGNFTNQLFVIFLYYPLSFFLFYKKNKY